MQGWGLRAAQTRHSADESEAKFSQRYKHNHRAQTRPGRGLARTARCSSPAGRVRSPSGGSGPTASTPPGLAPITENLTGINRSCLTACFWIVIFFCRGPVLGRIPFQLARQLLRRNKQTNKPPETIKGWQDTSP